MRACPICESSASELLWHVSDFLLATTAQEFSLRRCLQCQALYLDPLPNADELSGYYPDGYWWPAATRALNDIRFSEHLLARLEDAYRRFALVDHVRFVEQAARHLAGPLWRESNLTLLDVGCGEGLFLHLCRRRGFSASGLDISETAARLARGRYGIEVRVGSPGRTRFGLREYDIITMFHVLEHAPEPVALLRAAASALKPSGRLIVQVPNSDSLQARLFKKRWYGLDPPRHLVNFNFRSLGVALDLAGFTIVRVKHFSLRDNAQALASSLFPGLDPMARKVRKLRRRSTFSFKDVAMEALYLALVFFSSPLALLESALRRGATIMVEAKLRRGAP